MRKSYTGKFKTTVVLEILKEEKTISEIASQYEVHPNQLSKWRKEAITGLASVLEDGRSKEFLSALPEGYYYFADIPENIMVWLKMPTVSVKAYSGRGKRPKNPEASTKPVPISQIAKDNRIPWQKMILGEGAKGPIVSAVKCIRVVEAKKDSGRYLPYQEIWLHLRKHTDGKIKYAFCNAPADISQEEIVQASLMRWPIEQCFEECKTHLGMDHYEARSWSAWHRHMLYEFIAHLFVIELRLLCCLKKTPILTMPQAKRLITASLSGDRNIIRKVIDDVNYHMKRNYVAYKSHQKRNC